MSESKRILEPECVSEVDLDEDPVLKELLAEAANLGLAELSGEGGDTAEPALNVEANRPFAVDLSQLWESQGFDVPTEIKAALGPRRPVLLHHTVTPFAGDGFIPSGIWGLGYEFRPTKLNANTVSVFPHDEALSLGELKQDLELGVGFGGELEVPQASLALDESSALVSLQGASIHASTSSTFKIGIRMKLSLRKVLGAGVGTGGAKWQMYRQDEPLEKPHVLLQTLLVPDNRREFKAEVRYWAKKGFVGTRFFSRLYTYPAQTYIIDLRGGSSS